MVNIRNNGLCFIILLLPVFPIFAYEIDLVTAERLALDASNSIRNTREHIYLASRGIDLGLRDYLPQLGLNYSSSRQVVDAGPDSDAIQLGLNISQMVFDGGRMLKTMAMTAMQIELKSSALEQQIQQLRDEVWQLFFNLLLSMEKISLKRELLDISTGQLNISRKKYEMGLLSELDYLEAAVEVQNMEINFLDETSSRDSLIKDFTQLIGFEPDFFADKSFELTGNIDRKYKGQPLFREDHLPYEFYALKNNIDLKTRKSELRQLFTEYELLKTSWIPRFSLEGAVNLRGEKLPLQELSCSVSIKIDFPLEPLPSTLSVGAGVNNDDRRSIAVSAGNDLLPDPAFITEEKAKALELRQSQEALEDSGNAIRRSIYTSLEQIQQKRQRLDVTRSTQDLLARRLVILESRYSMGEIKELDLLKARVDYYSGEISICEGVLELLRKERELEKIMGLSLGGLTPLAAIIGGTPETEEEDIQ